ncbi:hypothetical protein QM565_38190 [Geitlerinema splendidum]|nr:hypothetical protein [Geitlerinema splendidum]
MYFPSFPLSRISKGIGSWELGVGEEEDGEVGRMGGKKGNWELRVEELGEEEMGKLANYQLSTVFPLSTLLRRS